jgi:Na+/proline symporter
MTPYLPLTILFFTTYVVISVLIGYFSSRKETEDGFMIADRQIGGVQLMATMSAGYFDGVTLSIYIAYVYQYGFAALALFVGLSGGFLVFRLFAPRIKRIADEIKAYSMPEFFLHLLGKKNALIISLILLTQYFAYLLVNFILAGKVLSTLFPTIPYWIAVGVGGLIILTYLLLAGFKAVVRTDFFQLTVMICMTLSAAVFFAPKVTINLEDLSLARMGVGNVVGFLIISSFSVMVGPDIWQRAFASKDTASLKRGLAYSSLLLPILAVIITVVGIATKQQEPGIPPDNALITAFSSLLPFGFKEFMLVLLYAVSLSSSDTATFVLSSIITRDLKNYSTRFNEESMRKMTRYLMVGSIIIAASVAMFYQQIVQIAFSMASLNLGLVPVVFASFLFKLNRTAVFCTLILVCLSVIALASTLTLNPETSIITLPTAFIALPVFELIARWWNRRTKNSEVKKKGHSQRSL